MREERVSEERWFSFISSSEGRGTEEEVGQTGRGVTQEYRRWSLEGAGEGERLSGGIIVL